MAIKQIEWAFFLLREDFPPKLSGELRVRNTKPACPPTFRYYFIPPHQQERKGEKQTKKGKKTKNWKDRTGNAHSFRKQFYVTYKWKQRGGAVGLTRYKFPTLNISPFDGVFL